jgi:Flp pilus assembly protein TadG
MTMTRPNVVAPGGGALLRRFWGDQSGAYLVIAGLVMPVLVGFVGLGTEVGLWRYAQQTAQGAADSAALSSAVALHNGDGNALAVQAQAVTASYGLVHATSGVSITVNQPPKSGTHAGNAGAVEVVVQQPQKPLFSAPWSSQPFIISARAVAAAAGGGGCVVALNSTAGGAVTVQGSAKVTLDQCSMYANSSHATALSATGSSAVSALSVGLVGGVSGASRVTATQGIKTGGMAISDPYAGVSLPSFSGCRETDFVAKSIATLDPGVYCGGMMLNAGAEVTLRPGIYYLDQGSLSVNGGAKLTGNGVTLVFTSSSGSKYGSATINGGATINLTASTSGPTAGIVMFGDRNMPAGTAFNLLGGSSQMFGGAIYLPKAAVTYNGGAETGTGCTQIIGDTVTFSGNSRLRVDCAGYATKPLGTSIAALVE